MQNRIESRKIKLALLNQRLAELDAERAFIQKEAHVLASSLVEDSSTGLWRRATVAAISVMAVASLLSASVLHNAQSSVKPNVQLEVASISALETKQSASDNRLSAIGNESRSQTGHQMHPVAGIKPASQRQWGPALVMPDPGARKPYVAYDPLVKQQQEHLLTLGFDLGEADGFKGLRTRQAIAEFRALYLPDDSRHLQDNDLTSLMQNYANLARSDAARFGIDHGIVAAIRLSSVRTGVDFSYLMKLAAAESNFEPGVEATTSSATGLYQFTRDTWLNTLDRHGAKYGLVADYAAQIEYYTTRSGRQRPVVRDDAMYEHLLALRKNPRLAAMMAAETVLENQHKLALTLDREPTETDLYLTHFLGADEAITFLRSLEHSPGMHAVQLFPRAARSNHYVFHPKTCEPRTVDEVYVHFGQKFSTRRYDDFVTN